MELHAMSVDVPQKDGAVGGGKWSFSWEDVSPVSRGIEFKSESGENDSI